MNKPHIGILHYTALPVIGGVENVIAEHIHLLTQAGYPVTLVTGRGGDSPALNGAQIVVIPELDSAYPENLEIAQSLDAGNVPDNFRTLQSRIKDQLDKTLAPLDLLMVHNVLQYHFNMPLTAALYDLLARDVVPMIAWCHDISRYVNPRSGAPQRFGFPWDLMRTFQPDLCYVTVSSRRKEWLAEILGCPPEHIRVIPNGVAPETLLGLSDLGRRIIEGFHLLDADLILLMPIRVTRAKNIECALQVTAALKRAGIAPKLVVTGPPDPHAPDSMAYFQELLAQRRELDIVDEAVFIYAGGNGFANRLTVDLPIVAELYRTADIVFMPSHREGFGLPVLEGGMTRAAVFATGVPAVDEVGADNVYLIAADQAPGDIAARMLEWAERDVELRLRRHVRQNFTWRAIFERELAPCIARCARRGE